MQLTCRVGIRDGKVYAVHESTLTSESILSRLWWPIDVQPELVEEGDTVVLDHTATVYRSSAVAAWCKLEVTYNANAKCEIHEEEEVPCPKVRKGTKVRWQNGRWEKLLQRGWVPA